MTETVRSRTARPAASRPDGPLLARSRYRIPMRDVDQAGVIYFPNPLAWHERLYTGWLAAIGRPLSDLLRIGEATSTVSAGADYLAPLALDDVIELRLYAGRVGTRSFELCTAAYHPPPEQPSGGADAAAKRTEDDTDTPAVVVRTVHVWSVTGTAVRAAGAGPDGVGSRGASPGVRLASAPVPEWLRYALRGGGVADVD